MERVQIDYYEGAYGKTIRFATSKIQMLIYLKELFTRMSSENDLEIELSNLENVKVNGLWSLCLQQSSTEFALGGNLIMEIPHRFVWVRSKEGWSECAELVDSIISSNTPSHQYLTSETYDAALVIVSFDEIEGF